jgi:hypothetical protein
VKLFSFTRQPAPRPQPCHACGHPFAGAVCPLCKEDRPAYTALKRLSERAPGEQPVPQPLPPCRYAPKALCNCGGRGLCLPAA